MTIFGICVWCDHTDAFFYILAIIDQLCVASSSIFQLDDVFSICPLHPLLTGPVRQISLSAFITARVVLHPSISALPFLPTFYLICLIPSRLPSDENTPPLPPHVLHISLVSSLASLVPLLSFPPANCWNVLAIFGVSLPSSSSSCHIFHGKKVGNYELSLLFGSCVTAW